MRAFLALVDDLYTPFDPALHCDPASDGFVFTRRETEGQITEVEIERKQSGLAILASLANRNVLLSWTRTDDPANAELFARGYIAPDFSGIFDLTQTIRVVCAPRDIETQKLAFAKLHLVSRPDTDDRFSDFDENDPNSYLLGRSAVFHVDPCTHEIWVTDIINGAVLHHLEDLAFGEDDGATPVSSMGEAGYPPKTLRYKLTAAWTQEASGTVDIANLLPFNNFAEITSLDPSFGDRLPQQLSFEGADGWSLSSSPYAFKRTTTLSQDVLLDGPLYDASHQKIGSVVPITSGGQTYNFQSVVTGGVVHTTHQCNVKFEVYHYTYSKFLLDWTYSQERQENVYFAMDLPIQPTLATSDTATTIELSVKDPFRVPSIPDYEPDTDYEIGDPVYYKDQYFRAKAAHHSDFFTQKMGDGTIHVTQSNNLPIDLTYSTIFWEPYLPGGILYRASTISLFETRAGDMTSYVDHLACRARAEARRLLRLLTVTVACRWEDGVIVTTKDEALIRGPEGRTMRGKVIATESVWGGETGQEPHVKIMVGIPFGDGTDLTRPPEDPYAEPGYAEDIYAGTGYAKEGSLAPTSSKANEIIVNKSSSGDPLEPVDVLNLRTGGGAVAVRGTLVNDAAVQLAYAATLDDPTQASVEKATYMKDMRLTNLAPRRPISRDIDVIGYLITAPRGYDLDG